MFLISFLLILIGIAVIILFGFLSIKVTRQYERAVVFRLGKLHGLQGPGLFFIIPGIDRIVKVDLRIRQLDVPKQTIVTRDNIVITSYSIHYTKLYEALVKCGRN